MITISVHSSFIDSAVYNKERHFLRIEIKGTWYYYYGITPQKVSRFRNAESKGRYFIQYIKGRYEMARRSINK